MLVKPSFAQETAPNFTLTNIDGVEFSLNAYRGKVVLLDFFTTFCSHCMEEIPILSVLHEEFDDQLVIISISISPEIDTVEKLQLFRQEHNITWIVARDTSEVNVLYNVPSLPTLVVIDQSGYIRYRHVGLTSQQTLQQEIYEIVPEFGTWISTALILSTLAIAVVIFKRKMLLAKNL